MPPDDLEPRVSALETQVHQLSERVRASEHDAAAARILAGATERDTGTLSGELRDFRRAATAGFNTLREDLTDLRGNVTELRADLTDLRGYVDEQFGRVNNGFIEMRGKFDATAVGQQRIVELLEGLIAGQG
ncbi:hypothetical protein [Mycobacterium sp.]|uniref:hypothetical protein n=1 Tax=Mycobacterium sp. TaxID=1785 RepID=UPI0031D46C98